MRGLGSPNYCTHDDACAHNVNQASYSLTGHGRGKWIYDFKNCRHIVVQGRNFLESLKVGELNQVLDALDKGCRLTCVDVRPTVTGLKAQQNLCIRPGTDLALNLAVLHVLIEEKLYDAAYVERYVQDFEALADFVRPYSPQWAESRCDIPADVIAELARSPGRCGARRSLAWRLDEHTLSPVVHGLPYGLPHRRVAGRFRQ